MLFSFQLFTRARKGPRIQKAAERIVPPQQPTKGDYTMRPTSLVATLLTVALAGIPFSSVAPALRAAGQTGSQPPTGQAPSTVRVQTNVVNVFATVRDKHNQLLPNLTKDD